jgi:hypothetical protein
MEHESSRSQEHEEQLVLPPMVFSDDVFGQDKAEGQEQQQMIYFQHVIAQFNAEGRLL